jgi:hypothetical protein
MYTGKRADLQYYHYQHDPSLQRAVNERSPIRLVSGALPSLVMLSGQWRTAAAPAPAPFSTQAKQPQLTRQMTPATPR